MDTLQQPERALVTLLLLLSLTLIAMIAIRRSRGLMGIMAALIHCWLFVSVGILLIFGTVAPAIRAVLGAGPLD